MDIHIQAYKYGLRELDDHPVKKALADFKKGRDKASAFVSHEGKKLAIAELTKEMNEHGKGLKKRETQFYRIDFQLSPEEARRCLQHEAGWKDFLHKAMDSYAKELNRGISGKDLVYAGRMEASKGKVQLRVLVGRMDKMKKQRLSPLGKPRMVRFNGKKYPTGMDHGSFQRRVEQLFAKSFELSPARKKLWEGVKTQLGGLIQAQKRRGKATASIDTSEDRARKVDRAVEQVIPKEGKDWKLRRTQLAREVKLMAHDLIPLDERSAAIPLKVFMAMAEKSWDMIRSGALQRNSQQMMGQTDKQQVLNQQVLNQKGTVVGEGVKPEKLRETISQLIKKHHPGMLPHKGAIGKKVHQQAMSSMKQQGLNAIPKPMLVNILSKVVSALGKNLTNSRQGIERT